MSKVYRYLLWTSVSSRVVKTEGTADSGHPEKVWHGNITLCWHLQLTSKLRKSILLSNQRHKLSSIIVFNSNQILKWRRFARNFVKSSNQLQTKIKRQEDAWPYSIEKRNIKLFVRRTQWEKFNWYAQILCILEKIKEWDILRVTRACSRKTYMKL